MLKLALLALLAAVALATDSYHQNRANEAHANYQNGVRQAYVNKLAERVGSGTGTANKYGVPGTLVGHGAFVGHAGYGGAYNAGYHGARAGYGGLHGYGKHHQNLNAYRQLAVNKAAEAVGAGTGTADKYGVPGTRAGKY